MWQVLLAGLLITTTPVAAATQPVQLSAYEAGVIRLYVSDLEHYAHRSAQADTAFRFWKHHAVIASVDRETMQYHAVRPAEIDTFFVAMVIPPEISLPTLAANFDDQTRTMKIQQVLPSSLLRAATMVHELGHAADNLYGIIDRFNESDSEVASDEVRAYQHEGLFLNEATNGRWNELIDWGLNRRIASYPPLAPDRYRIYQGFEQIDLDSIASVCHLEDPTQALLVTPLYELAIGYRNIEQQYSHPDQAWWKKIELTKNVLRRQSGR